MRIPETSESRKLAVAMIRRLAAERAAQGLPVKDIAWRCGASLKAVYSWERGDRMPSLPHLIAWAAIFGLKVELLAQ